MVKNTIANSIVYTYARNLSVILVEQGFASEEQVKHACNELFMEFIGESIPIIMPKKKKTKDYESELTSLIAPMKIKKEKEDPFKWKEYKQDGQVYFISQSFMIQEDYKRKKYGKSHYLYMDPEQNVYIATEIGGARELSPSERQNYDSLKSR
jgi:hypothetical protein